MADEYDGRVVIDTKLDNSGFEKGSEKLKQSVSGLARALEQLSGTASKTFAEDWKDIDPAAIKPEIDTEEFDEDVAHVKAGLKDIQDSAAGDLPEPEPVQPTIDSAEFDKATDKMQARLNRVTNEVYRIVSASSQGFRNTAGVLAFDNQLSRATDTIEDAKAALKEFAEQQLPTDAYKRVADEAEKTEAALEKLRDKQMRLVASGQDKPSQAWKTANEGYEAAMASVREYGEAIRNMSAKGIHSGDNWEFYKSEYQKAVDLVNIYEARLDELESKNEQHSQQWRNLSLQIEQAEKDVAEYEAQLEGMRQAGEAFVDPSASQQYADMKEQIENAEGAIRTNVGLIRQEQIEQQRLNVLTAQEKVAAAGNVLTRKLALAELQRAQNQLAAIAQKSVTPAPDPNKASAWQRFGSVVSKAGGAVLKVGRGIGSVVGTIGNVTKKITGGLKGLFNRARGASGVDGLLKKLTSIKGMLISRIKHTFISELFNDISEAFKELAKFDSRFDRSISNMKNRTKELGANVMGALGGLIRQIEPYITALIDRASEGVQKISAVFAALRGESTVQVAVRQTESYADSLRDATKEAKAAKTAQDKLNTTLTSYDEIHKLADNDAAADDTNAGSEAERELYQNVPVGSILRNMDDTGKKIVDRLVQAVKDGDWKGAGNAIAEGFNLGVRKLDEAILGARERVIKGTRGIAEALNGLTDGFDAFALGKTLADGVELGLDAAYTFLTTYDFGKFGKRIADGINGFTINLNAEKVGRTIASGLNAAINFGFDFVTNLKWEKIGEKLGTTVNRIFRDVNWGKAAQTVGTAIVGIVNSISSFLETVDSEQVGRAIIDFLGNVPWGSISKAMFRLLGAAIGGIGGLIKGAFEAIAEKSYAWGEHLFDEYGSEFNAAGEQVGKGIWEGIKSMFKGAAKKVKETIFDPFVKGFKKAFGIASPSKEMMPYGEFVGDGILEGVGGVFSNIGDWVRRNVLEPFKRGFSAAFNIAGDKARALIDSGKSIAGGIKDGISNGWTSITTMLDQKKRDLTTAGANFASSIGGGISGAWSTVTTAVSNGLDSIGNIDTGKLTSAGANLVAGLKDGITGGGWDSMVGRIWERYDDLKRWFDQDGREGFKQSGEYMVDGLNEGLREKFSITLETVHNGGQAAVDAFNRAVGISSPSKAMAESGRYMMDGLTLGIQQESSRTYNAIRSVAAGIVDEVSGTELKPEMDMTTRGLDRVADKLAGIAQIFQTINSAFADFTRVPLPAIVTGAYAPAGTRVTDISGSGLTEIRQMLGRFLDRAAELEEKIDSRPVRVDVHAEIDKREIARATAEVRQDNSNINNGGGGRW